LTGNDYQEHFCFAVRRLGVFPCVVPSLQPPTTSPSGRTSPSGAMPTPSLPVELWEHVLSNLGGIDDWPALRSACLVCRAWLPPAQRQLFAELHVDGSERCLQIADTFDTSPHLPPLVRRATLRDLTFPSARGYQNRVSWLDDDAALQPRVLARCPNLDALVLWQVKISRLSLINVGHSAPGVKTVYLTGYTHFETGNDFFRLLHSFPRLMDVHMHKAGCGQFRRGWDKLDTVFLRLRHFSAYNMFGDPCPNAAGGDGAGWQLEVDEIDYTLDEQFAFSSFADLLEHVSGSVVHLHVRVHSFNVEGMLSSAGRAFEGVMPLTPVFISFQMFTLGTWSSPPILIALCPWKPH
jgi:hypothetical protein